MKKYLLVTILLMGTLVTLLFQKRFFMEPQEEPLSSSASTPSVSSSSIAISWPLERSEERKKLLTFGLYVTPDPENNPISPPERFTGYHSGLDIEILPGEETIPVPVRTICTGPIRYADIVEGYGGVIIQNCEINEESMSVLYGHIYPNSFRVEVTESPVETGTVIAELSPKYSPESGLTRKHLHLGIHRGTDHLEFRGYVDDPKDLAGFIDPATVLK